MVWDGVCIMSMLWVGYIGQFNWMKSIGPKMKVAKIKFVLLKYEMNLLAWHFVYNYKSQ